MQIGDRVQAKLVEAVGKDQWIVSFQGHLLQVRNTTSLKFQKEKVLSLEVVSAHPIQLKIVEDYRPTLKIDRFA